MLYSLCTISIRLDFYDEMLIKLIQNDNEKIIDVDIKTLIDLDKEYYDCITSDKYKKEEYIEYGLDDKYESIEAFERFIQDKGGCFEIKSKLDIEILQIAYRFNKLNIYHRIDIENFDLFDYASHSLYEVIKKKLDLLRKLDLISYMLEKITKLVKSNTICLTHINNNNL